MAYKIIFDEKAIDFLDGLPKNISKRIFDKIIAAKEDPFHYFGRLEGRTDFKLRVGDYRVIADIRMDSLTIKVTLIGNRKNVYKRI